MRNLLLILASFYLFSARSFSFPSNTRLGYSSCQSCHISPTGGGVLTSYGKMTADEFLSAYSYEGEGTSLYGLADSPYFNLGGDIRYIYTEVRSDTFKLNKNFLMQNDLELALTFKNFNFVASAGFYTQPKHEFRRVFILYKVTPTVSLRLGRFYPAYGIHIPDHKAVTREGIGFGQGKETYNLELSFSQKYGELFITKITKNKSITDIHEDGPIPYLESENGATIRGSLYIGKRSQIGISLMQLTSKSEKNYAGIYGLIGFNNKIYSLFDISAIMTKDDTKYIGLSRLAVEITKGVHSRLTFEYLDYDERKVSTGIQLFPRPHWEIVGSMTRYETPKDVFNYWSLLLHYYL